MAGSLIVLFLPGLPSVLLFVAFWAFETREEWAKIHA